jgi:hypothetical protein
VIAAEESPATHAITSVVACTAAVKEENSCDYQADDGCPCEAECICSKRGVVSVDIKNIAGFDKCDSTIINIWKTNLDESLTS